MKKYLTVVSLLTLVLFGLYYLYYFDGSLYLPNLTKPEDYTLNFRLEGRKLYRQSEKLSEPFEVRGVDLESSTAGHHANDFALHLDDYLSWFHKISDMGANTIRVKTVMNVDFYDALLEFNRYSNHPLYLLQGVRVDDYRDNSRLDAFDDKYRGQLIRDIKGAIDVTHGRRQVWNTNFGSLNYNSDVSKWILGFVIGDSWNSGTIAYTNHQKTANPFKGEYFRTVPEANSFEVMLAQVLDEAMAYESRKYGWQHLISVANSPMTDPFIYAESFAAQAPKYVQLDLEHIQASPAVRSGLFASYQVFDFHPLFTDYLLEKQERVEPQKIQDSRKLEHPSSYMSLLEAHHELPVLVLGYGYSTARGIDHPKKGNISEPLTEREQGELLVRDFKIFQSYHSLGATINSWQDDWNARSWNTSYSTDRHTNFLWGDVQTTNTGFGLMTYEARKGQYQLDGDLSEWSSSPLLETGDGQLYAASDPKYLYLAIKKAKLTGQEKWVLPIDVTPKSGSESWSQANLTFDRPADFLLLIGGGQGQLLVQDRYNGTKMNYLNELAGEDPFVEPPAKDSREFQIIEMVLKNNRIFDDLALAKREDKWLPPHKTGQLRKGQGRRGEPDFDSQTDCAQGKDGVEIRIPWQLLNFSNPADGRVHDDYYDNYGVQELKISELGLGLADRSSRGRVEMTSYPLKPWSLPDVKEVLKESYGLVQAYWTQNRPERKK